MSNNSTTTATTTAAQTAATTTPTIPALPAWVWSRLRLVGIHDGVFHADDLVGAAMIKLAAHDVKFIRSREPDELKKADIIFDVGCGPYDHHSPTQKLELDENGAPFCGASKLWLAGLAEALLPGQPVAQGWFYTHVLTPISLQDNGWGLRPGDIHYFQWVSQFNPDWDDDGSIDDPDPFESGFEWALVEAEPIVRRLLEKARAYARGIRWLTEHVDREAWIAELPSGEIQDAMDWLRKNTDAKFAVYPGTPSTPWYAQCVPEPEGDLNTKQVPFPGEWLGLRGDKLSEVAGIQGAIFCHNNLFLTGWRTKDQAITACEKALEAW